MSIEHEDTGFGPYLHNMQTSKSVPHEQQKNEENVYELITDYGTGNLPPVLPNNAPLLNSSPAGNLDNRNMLAVPSMVPANAMGASNQASGLAPRSQNHIKVKYHCNHCASFCRPPVMSM